MKKKKIIIFTSVYGRVKMQCNQKDNIILIYLGEIKYCYVYMTSWWYVDEPTVKFTVYYLC